MKSRQNTLANYEKDCPGIPVHVLVSDLYNKKKKTVQQNEIIFKMTDCKLYL